MSKKLSYVLLGDPIAWDKSKTGKEKFHSGLWQWRRAFDKYGEKGETRLIYQKEELEKYDIVHINLTGGDMALPHKIRDELGNSSSTKLIVNMDFDPMLWGQTWIYPTLTEKSLIAADMVFQVESRGAKYIERIINKKVYTLPHPVDIHGLDEYKKVDREPTLVTVWHRYIQDCMTPYYAQRDLPLFKVILGYMGATHLIGMFDWTYKYLPFLEAIEIMSKASFGYDMYMGYSYGRAIIEFAALAVPCICSNTIEAAVRCFPELATHPLDIQKQHALFMELIENEEKKVEIYKYAYNAADYYSLENCYNRMVDAIEDREDRERQHTDGGADKTPKPYTMLDTIPALNHGDLEEKDLEHYFKNEEIVKELKTFWGKSGYKESQEQQTRDIILKYCQDIHTILDAGAGTCRVGKALKNLRYQYVAVDFSDKMLAECDPEFEVHVTSVMDLPFSDESFDLVMCLQVIRHNNPKDYIAIVNEVCRVSGKYVLILNPFVNKKEEMEKLRTKEIWDIPMLLPDLDAMMEQANLHRIVAEKARDDYKKTDYFVLYLRDDKIPDGNQKSITPQQVRGSSQ